MSEIPDFASEYYLPDGEYKCTFEEIEEKFLFSETREHRWGNFKTMLDRMIELGLKPKSLIINGSFVTKREEPGDVDFAALISPEVVRVALKSAKDDHDRNGIKLFLTERNQNVLRDLFGAHLLLADGEEMLELWSDFFRKGQDGELREPDPDKDPAWVIRPESKGILRVDLA